MNEILNISVVIELNTSEFTDKEYRYPNGSRYEYPEGWRGYWKNCLKDSGLTKVEQVITEVPMVDITAVEDDELKIIVKTQLNDTNLEDDKDIISFEGGVVVEYGDSNIIPQCCTSISDYKEWADIVKKQPGEWTQIWVGHPWIFA